MREKILSIGVALGMLFGCTDMINLVPEDATTYSNFFKSEKDAEGLLVTLQHSLRAISGTPIGSHFVIGAIADTMTGSMYAIQELSPESINWSLYYRTLNDADMIIENVHRFPEPGKIEPYALQGYFAKAMAYFQLGRKYGEVPVKRSPTYVLEKLAKSPIPEVLEEATQYGLKALALPKYEDLKDYLGNPRTTKQYGSKGSAAALLAHIYAWRAEIEQRPEFWDEAEKYCTMIISGEAGYYELAPDPEGVAVNVMHRNHPESIWETYQSTTETGGGGRFSYRFTGFPIRIDGSLANPKETYDVEVYKTTVNRMFDRDDRRRDAWFWAVDADSLFVVKDPKSGENWQIYKENRGTETVYVKYNQKTYHSEVLTEGFTFGKADVLAAYDNKSIKKAFAFKYRRTYYITRNEAWGPEFQMMDMNLVFWRLADIILLRAESRVRKNSPDLSGATADLNRIRERAYGNRSHDYTTAEGDLKAMIFREREKELLFEDHRFYDVVRNGWDYVRSDKFPPKFSTLTDQDIRDGALYWPTPGDAFSNNDLMRQNVYWNRVAN